MFLGHGGHEFAINDSFSPQMQYKKISADQCCTCSFREEAGIQNYFFLGGDPRNNSDRLFSVNLL